jgi:putative hydrolase of HD superfamily
MQNISSEANLVHQIDKFEMALQAKIYQKKDNSEKTKIFFESAKKEIENPKLIKFLQKLNEK